MTTDATGEVLAASGETARHITGDHVLVAVGHGQEIRWQAGERLEGLFEERCDRLRAEGRGDRLAVDAGDLALTYGELDERANRLARHLLARGVRPGDRVGLLFDGAVRSYVGMLAVLKVNAAYVPLDAGYPPDRLAYITGDAGVRTVLSMSHLREHLGEADTAVLCVDEVDALVDAEPGHRLTDAEKGTPVDDLCYIVYTSGSTGRPKGVAIEHASICNFVRVAVEVYGVGPADRMYQGMTIAFDFSVEEIWVPLIAGATLVPKPSGSVLVGHELREFLRDRRVTALCCVPTLLATLDGDLPLLRFLLVSGEACPQELVARWHRPDRRFLNVYGPTEATVTATWTPLHPEQAVTIGVPLPTYAVVILDPDEDRALPPGETGEIGIAGIGLASGYVNRDDLTARKFVRDFIGIDRNPSGRIYRTGDLGRFNAEGEVEYHGRIDTQVKIRGYRIELSEIESVLSQAPGLAQVVVGTYEPEPGTVELVAYYTRRNGAGRVDRDELRGRARERLPGYMVPAYFEELDSIPMLPSDKADRGRLPPPSAPRGPVARGGHLAPATGTERQLADALAQVMRLEHVSADSHFFDDLGADSLLMARFCAVVRERTDLPVSMLDVYQNPEVRGLAAVLAERAPAQAAPSAPVPAKEGAERRTGTPEYVLCGALQLLLFVATIYLGAIVTTFGYDWASDATGFVDVYQRCVLFGCASFAYLCALPVLAKWALIGRWKPQRIRVWSLGYVRFWTVKTLLRSSPMGLLAGSPLYVLYLRLLGARIGRGAVIFSRTPVCTDLLTVGAGTIIRENCAMPGYRADDGVIRTGAITLGDGVFVGDKTVLDIGIAMGDGTQLGHASSLHSGQAVPAGERWHGCPARPTDTSYLPLPPMECGTARRAAYSALQLFTLLAVTWPLALAVLIVLPMELPMLTEIMRSETEGLGRLALYADAVVLSGVLFFGGGLAVLAFVFSVPRVLGLLLKPGRVYRLYGRHYWALTATKRLTNLAFFNTLFGDSSYIVGYLRTLGYRFSRPIVQTGSNFGTELKHHSPQLTTVGSGTMVSDALWIMNADFSSTSFKVSEVRIGAYNFLGNNIAFPAGAAVGDNVLLGTKVAVPVDGPIRENTGLLGSPCFEIPRSVERDHAFGELEKGEDLRRRLSAKNRYNIATMGVFLMVQWFRFFAVTVLWLAAEDQLHDHPAAAVVIGVLSTLLFGVGYGVLVERVLLRFRSLRPRMCSIYDPYFWWHERLWKLGGRAPFNGTPFKNVVWRLLGVRVGRRVFDDGCAIPEKTLVTIGDECTLNAGSVIQCHSLEEGVFKSGRTRLGARCTLGVESFVHYDVTMGDGSALDADSFLMKGEEVPPDARWRGNPAGHARLPIAAAP
ncbi:Pls/PosA family non-ribosomal peptide synthetase [Actinomadura rubrisoli]|uniref:Amino acid adenylation domain-containing protein n=1 Tax=Actinomadura rubrisoli TaxID=2530368 RepID=A0A4R5B8U5_9ACTN|nr:Pls/PosA family non-ribosomal peptide synthetase [Actinomadura rubrisoli]TDD79762.1 amino acid adenylation domain-containing protein [Actinomadura rubrisoli]